MNHYKATAGDPGSPPLTWPQNLSFARSSKNITLVLFAHPRCPCTRASLHELQSLLAQCDAPIDADVVFYRPKSYDAAWTETDTVRTAQAIQDVKIAWDEEGSLASKFHVETSGHILVYAQTGNLLYSGGITPRRGHEGNCLGRDMVLMQITEKNPTPVFHAVFGCSLHDKALPQKEVDTKESPVL